MKYALKGRWSRGRGSVPGEAPQGVDQTEPADPVAMPTVKVDPVSLASALDQLAYDVLYADLPLQEAWEQLRRDLLPEDHH